MQKRNHNDYYPLSLFIQTANHIGTGNFTSLLKSFWVADIFTGHKPMHFTE